MQKTSFLYAVVLFLLILAGIGTPVCLGQQDAEQAVTGSLQEEPHLEKIAAGPQDIKQKTGIYVFVAWMWVSVFVLIYFLRLKVKEADRLYRLRFFSSKKD